MIMWRHKVDINPIRMPMQIANIKDKLAAACTLLDIFHIYFHSIDWFVDIHKNNICTEKKHTHKTVQCKRCTKKKRIQQSARCIFSFLTFFFSKQKFVFVNGLAGLCHNWTQMNLLAYVDWNWWGWLGWK